MKRVVIDFFSLEFILIGDGLNWRSTVSPICRCALAPCEQIK